MQKTQLSYKSFDKNTTVYAVCWTPDKVEASSRAIVQIIHGAAEHIERYNKLAEFLCDRGFVVCGHDHIGHGKTMQNACDVTQTDKHDTAQDLGHMPLKTGFDCLLFDVNTLHKQMAVNYSGLPYIIIGHSMGSFILRNYLASASLLNGLPLDGAAIIGSNQQPKAISVGGNAVAKLLAATRGENYRSRFLDNLGMGAFSKKVSSSRTKADWICSDNNIVDAYVADPMCGQMFSVGAYAVLTKLTAEMVSAKCSNATQKDLPMFFMAGQEDPVGEFGKGVKLAVKQYKDAGCTNISCKLYSNMRHEILNETDKEQVYYDLIWWIENL